MTTLPSLDSLRCFVAAARLLSFRRAAASVALTPAAFGARIKQLEDQLERPLFARTTRSVTLTEAGLALLPEAERCLASASDCVRAARGEKGPPPLELTLGTRQELGLSWITPQLDELSRRFPTLDLHLYFGSGPDLLLRVRTLEIDCAVTSSRFTDPRLTAIKLHREDYAFVGSRALLRQRPFRSLDDAPQHTLLDASADLPLFRYLRDSPDLTAEPAFAKIVRLGSIEAIRQRVLQGAGVAVLPRYLMAGDLEQKTVAVIMPRVTLVHDYFRLVYRSDDPRASVYASLAGAMLEAPLR